MNLEMIRRLTEADAIASKEKSIREIVIQQSSGNIQFDGLGSVIVHHPGIGPKIMIASHMDEVGFIVRHISTTGMLNVMCIGSVEAQSLSYQKVRITKQDGNTQIGILHCMYNTKNMMEDIYVDIGVNTDKEVEEIGIQIGDMVTFCSDMEVLNDNVIMAKALDDRIGCYILLEIDKIMHSLSHPNDVHVCYTSSEEVGTRGAKCTSQLLNPDIIFIVDVASAIKGAPIYKNHRQLGKGYLVVHYDKTMLPNAKLIRYIKELSIKHQLDFQSDMFQGGGTDGAFSHLVNEGKLAIVLGIPLRYCHGSYAMCHQKDVENLIHLLKILLHELDNNTYNQLRKFD